MKLDKYIGMDVHQTTTVVTVLNGAGDERPNRARSRTSTSDCSEARLYTCNWHILQRAVETAEIIRGKLDNVSYTKRRNLRECVPGVPAHLVKNRFFARISSEHLREGEQHGGRGVCQVLQDHSR